MSEPKLQVAAKRESTVYGKGKLSEKELTQAFQWPQCYWVHFPPVGLACQLHHISLRIQTLQWVHTTDTDSHHFLWKSFGGKSLWTLKYLFFFFLLWSKSWLLSSSTRWSDCLAFGRNFMWKIRFFKHYNLPRVSCDVLAVRENDQGDRRFPSSSSCSLLGAYLLNGIVIGMPPHIFNVPLSPLSKKQVQWKLHKLTMPTDVPWVIVHV